MFNPKTGAKKSEFGAGLTGMVQMACDKLHSVMVYNSGAAQWYACLFIRAVGAGDPSPGATVPHMTMPVPSKTAQSMDLSASGLPVPRGYYVVVAISTTDTVYTEGPANEALMILTGS